MSSKVSRLIHAAGAGVLVLGVAAAGLSLPTQHTAPSSMEVKVGAVVVCPVIPAKAGKTYTHVNVVQGDVSVAKMTGEKSKKLKLGTISSLNNAEGDHRLVVAPGGHASGMSLSAEIDGVYAGISATRCVEASTLSWFVGVPNNKDQISEVVLSNTDEIPAEVDITAYGTDGRLPIKTGQSQIVQPGQTTSVSLEPMFTSPTPVTVRISVPQGRVAAFVRERGLADDKSTAGNGADWHPQSVSPRTEIIVPGVISGSGQRDLVIINPTDQRVEVKAEIMDNEGVKAFEDAPTFQVRPESTAMINVGGSFEEKPGAIRLTSDADISAAVRLKSGSKNSDFATAPAVEPFQGEASLPIYLKGRKASVHVANAGESASVVVSFIGSNGKEVGQFRQVSLNKLATAQIPVPTADVVSVQIKTTSPVAASLVIEGKVGDMSGVAIVPFNPSAADAKYANPEQDFRLGR